MARKQVNEMSFLDHLEDLRWHLIRATLAVVIAAALAFVFKTFIFEVESSNFPVFSNFFAQSRVFLHHEEDVVENCCFEVKEHTLTFSKHQKLLKSKNYS